MSDKSKQVEISTAAWINKQQSVIHAQIPAKADVKYSDIMLRQDGVLRAWLEVKSSHTDNLTNPRVFYNGVWGSSSNTLTAKFLVNLLNTNPETIRFIKDMARHLNTTPDKLKLGTRKGKYHDPYRADAQDIAEFFMPLENKYIATVHNVDIGTMVSQDWNDKGIHYLQADNEFYHVGHINPLGCPSDIPLFEGIGTVRVRFSDRPSSKGYEIQPEIKLTEMPDSDYSCKWGTRRLCPFEHLETGVPAKRWYQEV